jgi:hypothetical protein
MEQPMPTPNTTQAPTTDPAPAPTMDEQYPIHRVRFVNGRTHHRTKRPQDERWWDLLYAACGKTGYQARGFCLGAVTPCKGCQKAISGTTPAAA